MQREQTLLERRDKAEAAWYKFETQRNKLLKVHNDKIASQASQKKNNNVRAQMSDHSMHSDNNDLDDSFELENKKRKSKKTGPKVLAIDSSSPEPSDDDSEEHHRHQRHQSSTKIIASKASEAQKPIMLKDFQRIVVRRRDLSKWIEHEEYRHGIKGAFVKVYYSKKYLLAKIDSFVQGESAYKVE